MGAPYRTTRSIPFYDFGVEVEYPAGTLVEVVRPEDTPEVQNDRHMRSLVRDKREKNPETIFGYLGGQIRFFRPGDVSPSSR